MRWFALCVLVLITTFDLPIERVAAQEKKLATKISSPFKDVVWTMKKQPDSSKFGTPVIHDIFKRGKVQYGKHLGEDYWIDAEVPVLACADGYISLNTEFTGTLERPGWGGLIVQAVWLKYGKTEKEKVAFYIIYGHLDGRDTTLKPGDFVQHGQRIGKVAKSKSAQMGYWDEPSQLHLQFMLDPLGKYQRGKIPAGYDSFYKDGKLTPFDPPYRLLDHIAPSEVFDAKDSVAHLIKEEANPKRR